MEVNAQVNNAKQTDLLYTLLKSRFLIVTYYCSTWS